MRGLAILGCALALAACGGGGDEPLPPEDPHPDSITVRDARFGTEIVGHRVEYPIARFAPGDVVNASLELAGRPRGGALGIRWELGEETLESTIDLGDAVTREGHGDATFVGVSVVPDPPLAIGVYALAVTFGGAEVARYPFEVGPPDGAIASVVRSAATARGATVDFHPVDPSDVFAPDDTVHLTGCGDFGRATWIRAEWRVGDEVDLEGTRTITVTEDLRDTCFAFDFRPDGGWPLGAHEAVLRMNAREVGRYPFRVQESP